MWALVNGLITIGMLLIVPLGLRLLMSPVAGGAGRLLSLWPVAAIAGVASLWLPRGAVATGFAAIYALATIALAAIAVALAVRGRTGILSGDGRIRIGVRTRPE